MIEQYATNEEVMRIFKCSRPDVAFRAIRKYADEYPGHIEVVKVFGKNVVHRGDLMSFTRWYNENHRPPPPTIEQRRARLGKLIKAFGR